MISKDRVQELLEQTGALHEGHFELSSGLHSNRYVQCARLLQWPRHAAEVGRLLAGRLADYAPAAVVSPALGGVVIGQEVGRSLDLRAVFTERKDGTMVLRRGFGIERDEPVVVIEDVVTTGKSTREVVGLLERLGARVMALGAIVDRSGGRAGFDRPFEALLAVEVPAWGPADCPLCRDGSPTTKPGSRPAASRAG